MLAVKTSVVHTNPTRRRCTADCDGTPRWLASNLREERFGPVGAQTSGRA
jgi:hypothetical protein